MSAQPRPGHAHQPISQRNSHDDVIHRQRDREEDAKREEENEEEEGKKPVDRGADEEVKRMAEMIGEKRKIEEGFGGGLET